MSVDTTATADSALEARARGEIWGSFVSLLKAYAAILTTAGGDAPTVLALSDFVSVKVRRLYLTFSFNQSDGSCEWAYQGGSGLEMAGRFNLTLDGMVLFSNEVGGERKDMDHAAIDFLSLLREEPVPAVIRET